MSIREPMKMMRNAFGMALVWAVFCSIHNPPAITAQSRGDGSRYAIPDTDNGLPGKGPIRRYDWFKELWIKKRSAWAEEVGQDQGALVFLGDSITQGWGDSMGDKFAPAKVANRGISGDTTRGVLIRMEEDVLSLNPSGVVLLIGTNDLEEGAAPDVIAANLALIIAKLKAHKASMPIVLCKVFPSADSKKRPSSLIKRINELYKKAVYGDPQVTILETWTLFANERGEAKETEFPDLLHPNGLGYAKWAGALRPVLETLHLVPSGSDDSFPLEQGYESLFNGVNLTGWESRPSSEGDIRTRNNWHKNSPEAPPWPILKQGQRFDGLTETPDGRYRARNNRLVVAIPPEERKIQQLWTQEDFDQDFVLVLEFRATPNADSGVFIRGRQLQCRDYLLAGPYKQLQRYKPLGWNELVVTVKGRTAQATCNGEILEAAFEVPASGPIGLEGDRGQIEYRRLRIKRL